MSDSPTFHQRLGEIEREHVQLSERMADPEIAGNPDVYRDVATRYAEIEPLVQAWRRIKRIDEELASAKEMFEEEHEDEIREMARSEIDSLERERATLEQNVRTLLLPKDPNDSKNVVLEVRAGTGGDEATLFAGELFRMYERHAETAGWTLELVYLSESEVGGVKEAIANISGNDVYSRLKFESGVHRVQRVPSTESQGRVHTSAATVAILPEAEDVEIEIDEDKELRVDSFSASGPGGQHVNRTASAVRITHLPSGIVVQCQDEKSWHKNKTKALKVLRARLFDRALRDQQAQAAAERRGQIGSGDRSEKIRTYNFPQNRVTDHRIHLTLHRLDSILEGQLDELLEALMTADTNERMRAEVGS